MAATLGNTTTTGKYSDTQLGMSGFYQDGAILVANNPVSLLMWKRSKALGPLYSVEYPYVTPTTIPLVSGDTEWLVGVQFKDAISGSHAQVAGWLQEPGNAGLAPGTPFTQTISPSGGVSPSPSTLIFQHNGTQVGVEGTADFIDTTGFIWAITDDGANGRVTITPPLFVLAYAEVSANTNITATTEATANTVVTAGSITSDGVTPLWITVSSPRVDIGTTQIRLLVEEDGVVLGWAGQAINVTQSPFQRTIRRVPAAGNHVYSFRAFVDGGTGVVAGGPGGAGGQLTPAYIRVSLV